MNIASSSWNLMLRRHLAIAGLIALTTACTDVRQTQPERTATEQLLLSTAIDKALERVELEFPAERRVFVDTRYFKSYDEGYAISAIRADVLERGALLVAERSEAEMIVEVRSGALSINRRKDLVGVPSIPLPVPLAEGFSTPEIPLVKHNEQQGVAKIALTVYDAESGRLWRNTGPIYGVAWVNKWSVLGVGWHEDETLPEDHSANTTVDHPFE
jgi:hypothetical protein